MNEPSFLTVRIRDGALRGRRTPGGAAFLGVPFAAPPVGPLRWRPPQAPAPWTGVRDALAFGPDLPQPPDAGLRGPRQDEDGLYLNVWTPTPDPGAKLPVLVWLPGGGFIGGSGSVAGNDGARLAGEGAVVVTVNYRCGLFGFLAHPALAAESGHGVSGNYGLLDQLAALAWVRENIAAFGGDPQRVTASGVSAGSASIALLLASTQGQGAFQRAILQSPGAGRPLATLEEAQEAGRVLGDDLAVLRSLTWQELHARTSLFTPKVRALTQPRVLRPILDGWLLRQQELEAWRTGAFAAVPMIVGTNADEGSWATRAWPVATRGALRDQVERNFGGRAAEAAALYPAARDDEAAARMAELFADTQFNYGARLLARGMAPREPRTWKYLFQQRAPGQADGPHHTDEIPYVFGSGGQDSELSRLMRRAWVRFAAVADPGVAGWDPYRPEDDNHLVLDAEIRAGSGWRQPQLDFLDGYWQSSRP